MTNKDESKSTHRESMAMYLISDWRSQYDQLVTYIYIYWEEARLYRMPGRSKNPSRMPYL
jgi:hypothetical protein